MAHLSRRVLLGAAAGVVVAPGLASAQSASSIYRRAIAIDGLGGPGGSDPNAAPFSALNAQDISDVRASGLTAINVTVSDVGNGPGVFEATLQGIASCEHEIVAHPDLFMKVLRGADIARAKREGKVGLIYGFQDTTPFGASVDRVGMFYDLGLRISQVTYNRRNLAGDGCLEAANGGLSTLGHSFVEEFNHRKILLDLSHSCQRTQAEGIAACVGPLVISHTGCRALNDVPRNTGDAELRALAEKGGVAGIYFMPFLRTTGEQPHGVDVIAHLEHAIDVCGEDHVSLGTDGGVSAVVLNDAFRAAHRQFVQDRRAQGISAPGESEDVFNYIPEYNGPRKFETLAADLQQRGHSVRRIEKILGGNFARVFAEVCG